MEPRAVARTYLLRLRADTAVDHIGTGDRVLIVEETRLLKKGRASACVQRPCTGTAERIENSQVGVFLAYTPSKGRALIDRRPHLLEQNLCQDTERLRDACVPDDVALATKPRLALQMITAALDAGVGTGKPRRAGGSGAVRPRGCGG